MAVWRLAGRDEAQHDWVETCEKVPVCFQRTVQGQLQTAKMMMKKMPKFRTNSAGRRAARRPDQDGLAGRMRKGR